MATIVNAAPMFIPLGTDDKSIRPLPPQAIPIPSHLPKFYLFTAKGPVKDEHGLSIRELVDGGKLLSMYGEDTVDTQKPYYNHATKFLTEVIGAANTCMVQRVIPEDNVTIANVTIYCDVLKTTVPNYKRNTDGSIAYDSSGNPIKDGDDIEGYKVALYSIAEHDSPASYLGFKTVMGGFFKDSNDNTSLMYPIAEFRAKYQGEVYNNYGVAFDVPTSDQLNEDMLEAIKALPYNLYVYDKSSGTPLIVKDLMGSSSEQFVWKENTINPVTNTPMDIVTTLDNWYNIDNIDLPLKYPDFEDPYIYYDNIDKLISDMYTTEIPYINADIVCTDGSTVNTSEWFDFVSDASDTTQKYLLNIFNGFSSKRVPYFSVQFATADNTVLEGIKPVVFANNTPVFMDNGMDGTLSDDNYEKLVSTEMAKYIDPGSEVMDLAVNVESIFYDSGFSVDLKKELVNFITLRKDTFLVLSTREDKLGTQTLQLTDERAIAVNLKARLALAPESTYFGTPVARAMIVAGSGTQTTDTTGHRWPLTLHIAIKAARMMGAGDGKWNRDYLFTKGEDNIIENFINISPAFIPQNVKPALWSSGLVWPDRYDMKRFYFAAMQTVYDNDTSVLNNFFTAMAITKITKVAAAAHRKFTGVTEYTPDQLIEAVETYMSAELKDVFAGLIKVIPTAMLTKFDEESGYSWTTVVKMGANNSRTVNTFYIEAYRLEDLT